MEKRRPSDLLTGKPISALWKAAPRPPAAIYRDLVASLFTMRLPIAGFGFLYIFVCSLILLRWPDPIIFALMCSAVAVTTARLLLLSSYHKAGAMAQSVDELVMWERRYAALTMLFALLLAGLNLRVLAVHQPLMHTGTVSLVFIFGAGVVSRTSSRPRICVWSLLIAVVPTALGMLVHATTTSDQPLHGPFFVLFALLLLAVLAMSLDSVTHLYTAALQQLMTKHELSDLARNDALTGLPNRLSLREAFHSRLERALTADAQLAIHYLDLDGFKTINDNHGHPMGDRLLEMVAQRLLATIRPQDVAFRLGGDEFLLMQAGVAHRDEAELLARRVIKHLSAPYVFEGIEMRISVSVGIALTAERGLELDDLVACADGALYRSKARGKSQLQFCEEDDHKERGRSAA